MRRVPGHHFDVRAGETIGEARRCFWIQLDRDKAFHPLAEPLCRRPRARPNLQHLTTEIDLRQQRFQDVATEVFSPFGRPAERDDCPRSPLRHYAREALAKGIRGQDGSGIDRADASIRVPAGSRRNCDPRFGTAAGR